MKPLMEFLRNKETFFINYDDRVKREILNWLMTVTSVMTDTKIERKNGEVVPAKKFVILEDSGFSILDKKFHFYFIKEDVIYIYE